MRLRCARGSYWRARRGARTQMSLRRVGCGGRRRSGGGGGQFCELRLDGLSDYPRPGRPASITAEQVEDVVVVTWESTPEERDALVAVGDGRAHGAAGLDARPGSGGVRAQ
jgi:hypothetical protein